MLSVPSVATDEGVVKLPNSKVDFFSHLEIKLCQAKDFFFFQQ